MQVALQLEWYDSDRRTDAPLPVGARTSDGPTFGGGVTFFIHAGGGVWTIGSAELRCLQDISAPLWPPRLSLSHFRQSIAGVSTGNGTRVRCIPFVPLLLPLFRSPAKWDLHRRLGCRYRLF